MAAFICNIVVLLPKGLEYKEECDEVVKCIFVCVFVLNVMEMYVSSHFITVVVSLYTLLCFL